MLCSTVVLVCCYLWLWHTCMNYVLEYVMLYAKDSIKEQTCCFLVTSILWESQSRALMVLQMLVIGTNCSLSCTHISPPTPCSSSQGVDQCECDGSWHSQMSDECRIISRTAQGVRGRTSSCFLCWWKMGLCVCSMRCEAVCGRFVHHVCSCWSNC